MSQAVRQRLERLRNETDAESLADVIRRALAVYDLFWTETKAGGEIIVRMPNKEEKHVVII